jgi:hypothetical protein
MSWRDLLPSGENTDRVFLGEIAPNADTVNDKVLVTVSAYDDDLTWGPAPFSPRIDDDGEAVLPQEGDACVVLLAETPDPGEPFVLIVWFDPNA